MINILLLVVAIAVSAPEKTLPTFEECINGKVVWKDGTTSTCKLINEKGEKK